MSRPSRSRLTRIAALLALFAGPPGVRSSDEAMVDYNREIRPLLARRCFACHGPDAAARKAGLRLDRREAAVAETEAGSIPLVAGDPDASELIFRVEVDDDTLRMPPPGNGEPLTSAEVATFRRWVAQGAEYADHWMPIDHYLTDDAGEHDVAGGIERFRRMVAEKGRDPDDVPVSLLLFSRPTPSRLDRYAELGVQRVVASVPSAAVVDADFVLRDLDEITPLVAQYQR